MLLRRSFIAGLAAALAAPAIVRAEMLMPARTPLIWRPTHTVAVGFPNKVAPVGSRWTQESVTARSEWVVRDSGVWELVERPPPRPVGIEWQSSAEAAYGPDTEEAWIPTDQDTFLVETDNEFAYFPPASEIARHCREDNDAWPLPRDGFVFHPDGRALVAGETEFGKNLFYRGSELPPIAVAETTEAKALYGFITT